MTYSKLKLFVVLLSPEIEYQNSDNRNMARPILLARSWLSIQQNRFFLISRIASSNILRTLWRMSLWSTPSSSNGFPESSPCRLLMSHVSRWAVVCLSAASSVCLLPSRWRNFLGEIASLVHLRLFTPGRRVIVISGDMMHRISHNLLSNTSRQLFLEQPRGARARGQVTLSRK